MDLVTVKGVEQTSLREIAERIGITKPALYYHFASREDLLRSLVQPLIDDVETWLAEQARLTDGDPASLLADWFDLTYRHRDMTGLIVRELAVLGDLDLGERIITWRWQMVSMLVGTHAPVDARVRAITALGGLADCTVMFDEIPVEELRPAALAAALAALGLPAAS
jgi:AcrR family transcriptional regulator